MINNIKRLRNNRGITAQQLADEAGTSLRMIQFLESGGRKLTQKWMERLSHPLHCSPSDIIEPSNDETSARRVILLALVKQIAKGEEDQVIKRAFELLDRSYNELDLPKSESYDPLDPLICAAKMAVAICKNNIKDGVLTI